MFLFGLAGSAAADPGSADFFVLCEIRMGVSCSESCSGSIEASRSCSFLSPWLPGVTPTLAASALEECSWCVGMLASVDVGISCRQACVDEYVRDASWFGKPLDESAVWALRTAASIVIESVFCKRDGHVSRTSDRPSAALTRLVSNLERARQVEPQITAPEGLVPCVLCSCVGAACCVLCVFLATASRYWNEHWDTLDLALRSRTSLEKDNAYLRHTLDGQSREVDRLRARNERLDVEAQALVRALAARGEVVEPSREEALAGAVMDVARDALKADPPMLAALAPQVSLCLLFCCESSVSRLVDALEGSCWPKQTELGPREACGSVPLPRFLGASESAAGASVELAGDVETGLDDSVLALLLDCLVWCYLDVLSVPRQKKGLNKLGGEERWV